MSERNLLKFVFLTIRRCIIEIMADTTPKKHEGILTLYRHCQKTSREIAGMVGVSQSTVCRIIWDFSETGTTSPRCKGKCGRKCETSAGDDKMPYHSVLLIPGRLVVIYKETWWLMEFI